MGDRTSCDAPDFLLLSLGLAERLSSRHVGVRLGEPAAGAAGRPLCSVFRRAPGPFREICVWKRWNPLAFSSVCGLPASFSRVVPLCSREPWPGLRERSLFSRSRELEANGNFKSPEKGLREMDVSSAAETR